MEKEVLKEMKRIRRTLDRMSKTTQETGKVIKEAYKHLNVAAGGN